jgi:hypothetical protein
MTLISASNGKINFNQLTNGDAFGRGRTSLPLTMFDSSHRYKDNGLWNTKITGGGTKSFSANEGLITLAIDSSSGSEIIRETTKVFSYQPGKSLLNLNTFVLSPAKSGLRQRIGYFGSQNGFYFQLESSTASFVRRSYNTGEIVETVKTQSEWNIDKLDGTGPSGITLDLTKAQILWMDFEWLGVGSVRMGFIIDGLFIHCHSFHHANKISSTYITTASLPLRYEIKNLTGTASSSTLKQICSTVISEGGYELNGMQQAVATPVTTPTVLAVTGTYYPIVSIRLKSNYLDAIAILTALSIMAASNNTNYQWQIVASGTTSGGTWVSAGEDSSLEYNLTATSITGGRILASGFISGSNQSSGTIDILKEALFKFQLERNTFTPQGFEISVVAAASAANANIFASLDWEEVSR